ncbi:HpcH/HpaI aldolase/citrate lyase family protein [Actinomadura syzygii]|uniref:CoA ester lyase n=1 Tax=Actinomadura syzygii TaxID=1427538 RepID=A0A5D0U621_9ACTN|nr:CoA ester lyase [Actinomadura syzygii]TYC13173.1 CoA ester lyase [Actinomadura syzygii]
MLRSYLFAPGHRADVLLKAIASEADAVILDLEDAVPRDRKEQARWNVAAALADAPDRAARVRINEARGADAERDLAALPAGSFGIRVPKVEAPEDLAWVAERRPGTPLTAALESARGIAMAAEIAASGLCSSVSIGGMDLRRDLSLGAGEMPMLASRGAVVLAARTAGLPAPVDGVYPYLDDEAGLRREAEHVRDLGFFGKAAIHPKQLPVIHDVFTPSADEVAWARGILGAFEDAAGGPARTDAGEFVDRPVARRARALLDLHERLTGRPVPSAR